MLVPVVGTPMGDLPQLDTLEWIRTIAVARILMPKARVRLSAGRTAISDEAQAMAFFAGANSIFYGDRLLTTENPEENRDMALLQRLGMTADHQ
jgi:biotin synthase